MNSSGRVRQDRLDLTRTMEDEKLLLATMKISDNEKSDCQFEDFPHRKNRLVAFALRCVLGGKQAKQKKRTK